MCTMPSMSADRPMNNPNSVMLRIPPSTTLVDRMFVHELLPRIALHLLQAQRNAPLGGVDVQDHHLHLLTGGNDLARMDVLLGPGHFGDVHQALNPSLQLHEGAVVGNIGNAPGELGAWRVFRCDTSPRISPQRVSARRTYGVIINQYYGFDSMFLARISCAIRCASSFVRPSRLLCRRQDRYFFLLASLGLSARSLALLLDQRTLPCGKFRLGQRASSAECWTTRRRSGSSRYGCDVALRFHDWRSRHPGAFLAHFNLDDLRPSVTEGLPYGTSVYGSSQLQTRRWTEGKTRLIVSLIVVVAHPFDHVGLGDTPFEDLVRTMF